MNLFDSICRLHLHDNGVEVRFRSLFQIPHWSLVKMAEHVHSRLNGTYFTRISDGNDVTRTTGGWNMIVAGVSTAKDKVVSEYSFEVVRDRTAQSGFLEENFKAFSEPIEARSRGLHAFEKWLVLRSTYDETFERYKKLHEEYRNALERRRKARQEVQRRLAVVVPKAQKSVELMVKATKIVEWAERFVEQKARLVELRRKREERSQG